MSVYRDITADIVTPRTTLDYTASAIYGELVVGPQFVANVDRVIMAHPRARLHLKSTAMKALRNMGHPVSTFDTGRHTLYRMADPTDFEKYSKQQAEIIYSQLITITRAAAGVVAAHPTDAQAQSTHQFNLHCAIQMGSRIGKPIATVVAEAVPL